MEYYDKAMWETGGPRWMLPLDLSKAPILRAGLEEPDYVGRPSTAWRKKTVMSATPCPSPEPGPEPQPEPEPGFRPPDWLPTKIEEGNQRIDVQWFLPVEFAVLDVGLRSAPNITWWKELKIEGPDGQQIGLAVSRHRRRARRSAIASIPPGSRFALTRGGAFGIPVVVRQIPIPDPQALSGGHMLFYWWQD